MSDNDYRNAQRRYRRRLVKSLVLQAEVVCESHEKNPGRMQEALTRMLRTVMELRTDQRDTDVARNEFVTHLKDCAYGGVGYVERDTESANLVIVEGTFDLSKLSKRMIWKGLDEAHAEELMEVEPCL